MKSIITSALLVSSISLNAVWQLPEDPQMQSSSTALDMNSKAITNLGDLSGSPVLKSNMTVDGAITIDTRDVSVDGATLDNLNTTLGLGSLTAAEITQLTNIGSNTISATQWGYLGLFDQDLATTDDVTFDVVTVTELIATTLYGDGSGVFTLDALGEDLNIDNVEAYEINVNGSYEVNLLGGLSGSYQVNTGGSIALNSTGSITGATIEDVVLYNGTVDARDIATDGSTLDNLNTTLGLGSFTAAEVSQLLNINTATVDAGQWAWFSELDQSVSTFSLPEFAGIITTGNVDGRDVSVDGAKLDLFDQGLATTDDVEFGYVVVENTNVTGGLHVEATSGTAYPAVAVTASDDVRFGNSSFDNIIFSVGGVTNAVTIEQSTGDLGIGTTVPTAPLDVTGSRIRIRTSFTPTGTADSTGSQGAISWDDSYIYVKTSSGWERAALSTF